MKYWNKQKGYLVSGRQFTLNNITYPKNWLDYATDNDLEALNIIKEPSYDPSTQVLEIDGELGWVVREKTIEELDLDLANLEASIEEQKENLINSLWIKATKYEQTYISGSAPAKVGLLSLGGDVKATVVSQWVEGIWADYYNRKSQVLEGDLEVSTDFSNNGSIPYSIWEVIYGE